MCARSSVSGGPTFVVGFKDAMHILLLAADQAKRLNKKQLHADISSILAMLVENSGLRGATIRLRLESFMSSMAVFGTAVKGMCVLYLKQVEAFVKNCESLLIVKSLSPSHTPSPHTLLNTTIAPLSRVRSRRSSLGLMSLPPVGETSDLSGLMDLDTLCAELSRRTSTLRARPSFGVDDTNTRGRKKSRSGGSSHSEDQPPIAEIAFQAVDDVIDFEVPFELPVSPFMLPPEVTVHTPSDQGPSPVLRQPRERRRQTARRSKIGYSVNEWNEILKGTSITLPHKRTPKEIAESLPPFDLIAFRDQLYGKTPSGGDAEEAVSIANAVDDLDITSVLDDLRADEGMDHYVHDEIVPLRRHDRVSDASSFAPSSRRHSFVSDIFDRSSSRLRQSASVELKQAIEEELQHRRAKRGTIVAFPDIAPRTMISRKIAVSTFTQLLELANRGEIKFKCGRYGKVSFDDGPSFVLSGDGSSSESSSSDSM